METSLDIGKDYRHRYKLSIIPISRGQTDINGSGTPETLVHASTYERTNKATKMGISPENDSRCLVMGSAILPILEADDIDLELAIRQCKDRGVYLWNDAKEAAHQSLATVGLIKEDNPSLLIVDSTGLEKDSTPRGKRTIRTTPYPMSTKARLTPTVSNVSANSAKTCSRTSALLCAQSSTGRMAIAHR